MSGPAPAVRRPFTAFLAVGEESGDQLGAALMEALARLRPGARFVGVGGHRMEAAGLRSLFPLGELAVVGIAGIFLNLRALLARIRETADAVIAADPDVLVIVDSPEYTHRVAKEVRRRAPHIPIVDYVSPSVWAWRSYRARRMLAYVDCVLALLPFEPDYYVRLGGPRCVYVGHPLLQKVRELRPAPGERPDLAAVERPCLLVLPGSRGNEIRRLMEPFGEAVGKVVAQHGPIELVLPAVPHLVDDISRRAAAWPVPPAIVEGEAAKFAAFRRAHAALAATGTVSLELALAGVPSVSAYRIERLLSPFKWWVVKIPSVVLANIVLGENVVPEFIDGDSTPDRLAAALLPLLGETPERRRQVEAFSRLDALMGLDGELPAERAARAVLETIDRRRGAGTELRASA